MGEGTAISWAHDTVNFWAGCTKVSEACRNCYAERDTARSGFVKWGPGAQRRLVKNAKPNALRWNAEAERTGLDRRVFAMSWADWLDHEVDPEWLFDFLELIRATPNLTWLLLSKRLERWRERLDDTLDFVHQCDDDERTTEMLRTAAFIRAWAAGAAPHNVWLGTTVESQQRADERIPLLLGTPARLRFLSMEPLLEAVDISPWLVDIAEPFRVGLRRGSLTHAAHPFSCICGCREPQRRVDWIITGGESGPGWRPLNLDHVRAVRDACVATGIPFHHKQHAGLHPKALGRELDGIVWDQVPSAQRHAMAQLEADGRAVL